MPRSALKTALIKGRDILIGLALISALSYLPSSMVQRMPTHGQTAMGIAVDIRTLAGDMGRDTVAWMGSLVESVDLGSLAGQGGALLSQLAAWLPADDRLPGIEDGPASPGHAPRTPSSFSTAKDRLYTRIYRGHRTTFYCGCAYDADRRTDLDGCGLADYEGQTRADRVEAEHIFPASQFGNFRTCWRSPENFPQCREADGDLLSGRACCQRVDPVFNAAHNDLHNLVPAVGMINGRRSNHNWGMVPGGTRYGGCEILIDAGIRRVQPPAAVRGDIARVMLYMQDTYGFQLSRADRQLFAAWHNSDPPDAWEIERDRRIAREQDRGNRYVSAYRPL